MKSKLFSEWFDICQLSQGRKARGSVLLIEFKIFCNGRFKNLSRKKFYEMLREHDTRVVAENKKTGWWFSLKGFNELQEEPRTISWEQLAAVTDETFFKYVVKNKKNFLEAKYVYPGRLCGLYRMNEAKDKLPTKQEFTRWMRMAGLFLTGYYPQEGRNMNGKTMKF